MGIYVRVQCEKSSIASFARCQSFEPPAHVSFDQVDGWIDSIIEEHGWTALGDELYCPEHNPAEAGEPVTISTEYTELAPGVEVRLRLGFHAPGDTENIEVRIVPRECHGNVGAQCGGGTGPYGG